MCVCVSGDLNGEGIYESVGVCVCVCVLCLVSRLGLTLWDPMH